MAEDSTRKRTGRRRGRRQDLINWRRSMIVEQTSKGRTQREIAKMLRVGIGTVNRDLFWFREKAKEENANFIEKIQEEHEKSIIGLKAVLKEAWFMIENAEDSKEKLAALSLAKDCYALQEELICNLPIIDEALKLDSEGQETEEPRAADEGQTRRTEEARASRHGKQEGPSPDSFSSKTKERALLEGEDERQVESTKGQIAEGGEKEKDDIQGSEEKVRENQNSETTNKTF